MNIIRSKVVELSAIPAIAYKVKLRQGGNGIKMHRTDSEVTAFALVDKRTGEAIPDKRVDAELFPTEAFDEAVEALTGLAYSARGKVKVVCDDDVSDEEIAVPPDEKPGTHSDPVANAVDSDEYIAIIGMYQDTNGRLNYRLMNKQFIQFAARNKTVANMVAQRASSDDILLHIIKNRAAFLSGRRDNLTDDEARALILALDEMDTRGAFKDLTGHIRKMLSR